MTVRLVALTVLFVLSTGYVQYAMEPERVPLRQPLEEMSYQLGPWVGQDAAPLSDDVVSVLGVDEHVNRFYRASAGNVVSLYIGYYESQRNGDTIHSPMNCLPGSGWLPMDTTYVDIAVPNRPEPIRVKRVLIQKGLDQQVVLYWYHSHGRVVGNEYWSKVLMVYDAVRLNRSDAALVRVVSPVGHSPGGEQAADARAVDFVQELFRSLDEHLPR